MKKFFLFMAAASVTLASCRKNFDDRSSVRTPKEGRRRQYQSGVAVQ